MTTVEVLREVRDRLVTKGWTPGIGRCLYMTVEAVAPSKSLLLSEEARAAIATLRDVIGEASITSWNARQTSIDPVLAAVDAAIERVDR
jgi:hypothetical protein